MDVFANQLIINSDKADINSYQRKRIFARKKKAMNLVSIHSNKKNSRFIYDLYI